MNHCFHYILPFKAKTQLSSSTEHYLSAVAHEILDIKINQSLSWESRHKMRCFSCNFEKWNRRIFITVADHHCMGEKHID